jgi:protein-S-isoprenylcysteine O-methyltransferase Ste14
MLYLLRHLLAILILPTTAVVFVPIWIVRRYRVEIAWPASSVDLALLSIGLLLLIPGVALFVTSLHHFFTFGKGTLAPWDPPRNLVIRGPYRYVRNPMIGGVIFMLFAIALIMRSMPHLIWAFTFLCINAVYIPLYEERSLAHRFGSEYQRYRRHVRRFIPRVRPWEGAE